MGYLLEIAKKVHSSKNKSTSIYYELNELNEIPPSVVNNLPSTENRSLDQKMLQSLAETITPRTNMNASWSKEAQELIDWFVAVPKINEPFHLDQHRQICNPEKFYDSIIRDIQAGPSVSRNKHGVLMDDLKKLKIVVDGYNTDQSINKK